MKCPYSNPTPKQCFNCPFPDCVNDDLSIEEFQENVVPESVPKSVKMARNRANRYAENHRKEIRERSLSYYYENKETYNERSREWAHNNKARAAASKRDRYQRNIELSRQKQRDYRARIKKKREQVKQ